MIFLQYTPLPMKKSGFALYVWGGFKHVIFNSKMKNSGRRVGCGNRE